MNKQLLTIQLEDYGLDETGATIYLHLLENGPRTPLQLSRDINIDRSKVYRSVETLLKQRFIEQSHAAWGKKLQAASPENISILLREEEEVLKNRQAALPALIKELSDIPSLTKREFEVKHYRGQEGLRQMLWNQLAAKKELLAFSYKNRNDIVGKTYAEKIRAEQVARKIVLYEIENETDQEDYWYTSVDRWEHYYRSRYIAPKTLRIAQHVATFGNTVSIINWLDDEEVGVEIINTAYAAMQRQLFWKFWEVALESGAPTPTRKNSKKS
jgi:sugar-specific transcriptional regulator TrmB